jgi:DNA helicase-2/ATP-dependent DNA helicase PcrA
MPAYLNPPQLDAVQTLRGPLLVLAGAGTGKTRVVTYRIAELIRRGTKPDRILAVTFTKKAAGEMQERASELLRNFRGAPAARGRVSPRRGCESRRDSPTCPEISTFHSLCVRVLRRHIERLGYPTKFVICDRNEQESQARAALRELRAPNAALAPGDLIAIISRWKAAALAPEQAASAAPSERDQLAAAAYRRYQENLKRIGAVDFDDLLLLTVELLARFPAVRRTEAQRFEHILIDEYQDTNHSQYQIVKALAAPHRNLCVVGDDDQSIYGWRGAEVTHILRFQQDWPEAKIVRLEDNYRSTAAILSYANTLIAFNRQRHEKNLKAARPGGTRPAILQCQDEAQEAERVVGDIRQLVDARTAQPRDFAILCRTNEQPRSFETELRRANLPYVLVGGMSFFDRKEVRDILSYLKVIDNPHDEPALMRIINQPPRGIGNAAQKRLFEEATSRGKFLWEVLPDALAIDGIDAKTAAAVADFRRLIEQLRDQAAKASVAQLTALVLEKTAYRDALIKLYPDLSEREARLASLEEITNAAASYDKQGSGSFSARSSLAARNGATVEKVPDPLGHLSGFLDDMLLSERDDSDEKESQLARNAVALMTLHSAKGLEFPRVYLVGMEEGILPHKRSLAMDNDAAIDEERRLCYVGVTRARDHLTLSFALTRRKWGKPHKTVPSRFLYEMTGQAENFPPRAESDKKPTRRRTRKAIRR